MHSKAVCVDGAGDFAVYVHVCGRTVSRLRARRLWSQAARGDQLASNCPRRLFVLKNCRNGRHKHEEAARELGQQTGHEIQRREPADRAAHACAV